MGGLILTEKDIASIVGAIVNKLPDGNIKLSQANAVIKAVQDKAIEWGLKVVVAVADKHTNPVSVQCMDDSYIASYDIATNKAYTVTALKMPTTELKKHAAPGGSLYGIQFTTPARIVIFGGGVPLYDKNGNVVGGLGVSGASEEQDTALAEFGGKWFTENL